MAYAELLPPKSAVIECLRELLEEAEDDNHRLACLAAALCLVEDHYSENKRNN